MSNADSTDLRLSEEDITEVALQSLKESGQFESSTQAVTEYPVLEFDENALQLLSTGVHETLQYSSVKPAGGRIYLICKRLFDIVVSLIVLLLLPIPMGIIMLLICLEDKGNPIFSQIRLTEDGKPFRMYKLRSMCMDAEKKFAEVQKENQSDGIAFKSDDDPRITKIGKFIRKTSIDELPQFWNVLKGDMSLIGPRPPLPREVVLYTPEQMNRLLVKGGLSCICQTEGRSDMEFDKWVESDIHYIENRSFKLDISLLWKTAGAVLQRKGAK
ncbi:MAG: sugar transferase [Oscillospiraceae bacterium]|nr:sugar transferase [Oscillospiraceae bacterium]